MSTTHELSASGSIVVVDNSGNVNISKSNAPQSQQQYQRQLQNQQVIVNDEFVNTDGLMSGGVNYITTNDLINNAQIIKFVTEEEAAIIEQQQYHHSDDQLYGTMTAQPPQGITNPNSKVHVISNVTIVSKPQHQSPHTISFVNSRHLPASGNFVNTYISKQNCGKLVPYHQTSPNQNHQQQILTKHGQGSSQVTQKVSMPRIVTRVQTISTQQQNSNNIVMSRNTNVAPITSVIQSHQVQKHQHSMQMVPMNKANNLRSKANAVSSSVKLMHGNSAKTSGIKAIPPQQQQHVSKGKNSKLLKSYSSASSSMYDQQQQQQIKNIHVQSNSINNNNNTINTNKMLQLQHFQQQQHQPPQRAITNNVYIQGTTVPKVNKSKYMMQKQSQLSQVMMPIQQQTQKTSPYQHHPQSSIVAATSGSNIKYVNAQGNVIASSARVRTVMQQSGSSYQQTQSVYVENTVSPVTHTDLQSTSNLTKCSVDDMMIVNGTHMSDEMSARILQSLSKNSSYNSNITRSGNQQGNQSIKMTQQATYLKSTTTEQLSMLNPQHVHNVQQQQLQVYSHRVSSEQAVSAVKFGPEYFRVNTCDIQSSTATFIDNIPLVSTRGDPSVTYNSHDQDEDFVGEETRPKPISSLDPHQKSLYGFLNDHNYCPAITENTEQILKKCYQKAAALTTTVTVPQQSKPVNSPYTYIYKPTDKDEDTHSVISNGSRVGNLDIDLGEETETAAEGEDDSITRCICDYEHDDGYMIQCDKCTSWQHVDCMGIDRQNIPDKYKCEACDPRPVDRARARSLQFLKYKEQQSFLLQTAQAQQPYPVENTALHSNAPDRNLLNNNNFSSLPAIKKPQRQVSTSKRKTTEIKEPKRKRGESTSRSNGKRREPKKVSKRSKASKQQPTPQQQPESVEKQAANLRSWIENYESAVTNHYSPELRARLQAIGKQQHYQSITLPQLKNIANLEGKCTIVPHAGGKILISTLDLSPNHAITEIRGKYMLTGQYKQQHIVPLTNAKQNCNRNPGPFIFFYRLPNDGPEICVDTRTYGNDARFVRRSCRPNAEILHTIEKGTIHLYIVSLANIKSSTEITIKHEPHDLAALSRGNINAPTSTMCACGLTKDCLFAPSVPTPPIQPITVKPRANGSLKEENPNPVTKRPVYRRSKNSSVGRGRSTSSSCESNIALLSPKNPASSPTVTSMMHDSGLCTSSSSSPPLQSPSCNPPLVTTPQNSPHSELMALPPQFQQQQQPQQPQEPQPQQQQPSPPQQQPPPPQQQPPPPQQQPLPPQQQPPPPQQQQQQQPPQTQPQQQQQEINQSHTNQINTFEPPVLMPSQTQHHLLQHQLNVLTQPSQVQTIPIVTPPVAAVVVPNVSVQHSKVVSPVNSPIRPTSLSVDDSSTPQTPTKSNPKTLTSPSIPSIKSPPPSKPAALSRKTPRKSSCSMSEDSLPMVGDEQPKKELGSSDSKKTVEDKKLTREERKMQAIVRAFEKMEKNQQRKQELKHKSTTPTSATPPTSLAISPTQKRRRSNSPMLKRIKVEDETPVKKSGNQVRRKKRKGAKSYQHTNHQRKRLRSRINSGDSDAITSEDSASLLSPQILGHLPPSLQSHHEHMKRNVSPKYTEQHQSDVGSAAGMLMALSNCKVEDQSNCVQNPSLSEMPKPSSSAFSLSSALMLVEAAVGPLEHTRSLENEFKMPPKTKKTIMNEWLHQADTISHSHRENEMKPQFHHQISYPPMLSVAQVLDDVEHQNTFTQHQLKSIYTNSSQASSSNISKYIITEMPFQEEPQNLSIVTKRVEEFININSQDDEIDEQKWSVHDTGDDALVPQPMPTPPMQKGSSVKKRWLRQAISEECSDDVTTSPPNGYMTPLKKRRMARECQEMMRLGGENSANLSPHRYLGPSDILPIGNTSMEVKINQEHYEIIEVKEEKVKIEDESEDKIKPMFEMDQENSILDPHDSIGDNGDEMLLNFESKKEQDEGTQSSVEHNFKFEIPIEDAPPDQPSMAYEKSDDEPSDNKMEILNEIKMEEDTNFTPNPIVDEFDIKPLNEGESSSPTLTDDKKESITINDEIEDIQKRLLSFHDTNIMILQSRNKKRTPTQEDGIDLVETPRKCGKRLSFEMESDQPSTQEAPTIIKTEYENVSSTTVSELPVSISVDWSQNDIAPAVLSAATIPSFNQPILPYSPYLMNGINQSMFPSQAASDGPSTTLKTSLTELSNEFPDVISNLPSAPAKSLLSEYLENPNKASNNHGFAISDAPRLLSMFNVHTPTSSRTLNSGFLTRDSTMSVNCQSSAAPTVPVSIPAPAKMFTRQSADPRLNPNLVKSEPPPAPKKKLSINEYRKRKQLSSDIEKTSPIKTETNSTNTNSTMSIGADSTSEQTESIPVSSISKKSSDEKITVFSPAPTLLELQQESLSQRLKNYKTLCNLPNPITPTRCDEKDGIMDSISRLELTSALSISNSSLTSVSSSTSERTLTTPPCTSPTTEKFDDKPINETEENSSPSESTSR